MTSEKLNESLADVVRNGAVGNARRLLSAGADVNAADEFGITPLHVASWNGMRRSWTGY